MNVDLSRYEHLLSARLRKEAARLAVRECDEPEAGRFEGFVDDGPDSFDVLLRFAPDGALAAHSCDCGKKAFCVHRAALLLHIGAPKPERAQRASARPRKQSTLGQLLAGVSNEDLRGWLTAQLEVHKDLALAFQARFARPALLTPAVVAQQSADAVRAVAGRQQSIDATQVKKIVALFQDLHQPVLDQYRDAPFEQERFACVQAVFASTAALTDRYLLSSKKLAQYEEELRRQVVIALSTIADNDSWTRATGFLLEEIGRDQTLYRTQNYLAALRALVEVESATRRQSLTERFAQVFRRLLADYPVERIALVTFAYSLFEACGVLLQHLDELPSLAWQPEYNRKLLQHLLDAGHLERAEALAQAEIRNNRNDHYNLPYLQVLRQVYTRSGDEEKLTALLLQQLAIEPDIHDFDYVAARVDEEPLRHLRNRLLSRGAAGAGIGWQRFTFALLARESNWKKMIVLLATTACPGAVAPWLEQLKEHNSAGLLNALLSWPGPPLYFYGEQTEEVKAQEAEVAARLIELYGADAVQAAVERHRHNFKKPGRIWALVQEQLR